MIHKDLDSVKHSPSRKYGLTPTGLLQLARNRKTVRRLLRAANSELNMAKSQYDLAEKAREKVKQRRDAYENRGAFA